MSWEVERKSGHVLVLSARSMNKELAQIKKATAYAVVLESSQCWIWKIAGLLVTSSIVAFYIIDEILGHLGKNRYLTKSLLQHQQNKAGTFLLAFTRYKQVYPKKHFQFIKMRWQSSSLQLIKYVNWVM